MKKLFSILFIAILSIAINNLAFSQNVNVGPVAPNTYPTLGAAFAAINGGLHGNGAINVSIKLNTTELATANLNGGVFTSCLITPVGPITVTGNLTGALVDLSGADNVTIDGLNSGGNSLTFSNTMAAVNTTRTLMISNGGNFNTLRNLTSIGVGSGAVGTRNIHVAQGTAANNDNTIENCVAIGGARGIQTFELQLLQKNPQF